MAHWDLASLVTTQKATVLLWQLGGAMTGGRAVLVTTALPSQAPGGFLGALITWFSRCVTSATGASFLSPPLSSTNHSIARDLVRIPEPLIPLIIRPLACVCPLSLQPPNPEVHSSRTLDLLRACQAIRISLLPAQKSPD